MAERTAPGERLRRLRHSLRAAALALFLLPAAVSAQTPTTGLLRGTVRAEGGAPLANAHVILEEARSGLRHEMRTDDEGEFEFRLLATGTYSVLAEKLGYRPQVLVGVPMRVGRTIDVALSMAEAEPPVATRDTVAFAGAGVGYTQPGRARWFGELELAAPRDRSVLADVTVLATTASEGFVVEGLPAVLSRQGVEGIAFQPLGDLVSEAGVPRSAQALSATDHAELLTGVSDVQFDGPAGGLLGTFGRRGTSAFALRTWGSGADPELPLGPFSQDLIASFDLGRAGLEVSGPIIADTAVFLLGAEWRRAARALPRAWRIDDPSGAVVAQATRDSAGLSLRALTLPYVEERDELAAWGRFDWRIADGHQLASWIDVSWSTSADQDPLRATPQTIGIGPSLDAVVGATLHSILSPRFANELRAAVTRSTRDETLPGGLALNRFADAGIASTSVLDGSVVFGVDPFVPQTIERTAVFAEQALLLSLGNHLLKAGLGLDWETRDQEEGFGRTGVFLFGGPARFEAGEGAFLQTVGGSGSASWSTLELAAFLQDAWHPTPGLELIAGLRLSDERLPDDVAALDTRWAALTGMRNNDFDGRVRQFSPRASLRWDVRNRNRWIVRAGVGLYHDDVAPQLLGAHIAFDGGVRLRRAFGDVGEWPTPPDSALAPVIGPALAIPGNELRPPRSMRASFGLSRIGATSVHLSATYRHTDFLPARRDLNLHPDALAQDQYGRPVFGTLVKSGALVGVAPGSNRRFDEFDVVSALESTSFSDYYDATIQLERRVGHWLRLSGAYTWSRTEDDWLARPGLSPLQGFAPHLPAAAESDWAEGTSDFDVPHRVSLVAELSVPLPLEPTLGVAWRARSGVPFTPGFAPGVDLDGDYASNDPAFIDPDIEGMDALLDQWDCLRDHVSEFAQRNSCRGDMLQFLDARLGLRFRTRLADGRVFVDALNLLGTELAPPDAALLLVDEDAPLQQDDGTVSVPFVANPGFGQAVRSHQSGRIWRIGVEVGL